MKHKQPSCLEDLAVEAIGTHVLSITENAIRDVGSGRTAVINITGLHQFIHGDLSSALSRKMTTYMFKVIRKVSEDLKISERTFDKIGGPLVKNIMKNVILGSLSLPATILNLTIIPRYAQNILTEIMHRFRELQTLNVLSTDLTEFLPPIGLNVLNLLVYFKMTGCSDAIIGTLASCCSKTIKQIDVRFSRDVTNASFEILTDCHKLTHLSISGTSMTAEGFVKYLRIIQEHQNSDDQAKDFLQISAGGSSKWKMSSSELNEIAITCPKLKKLEIAHLIGDMETLGNLNDLEELEIGWCAIRICNLDGFLSLRGCKLTSLKLQTDQPLSLISIMNHCRNLKELKLFDCNIMDTDLEHIETAAEAFQSLEILDFRLSRYSLLWIEHVLQECVNIKHLCLYPRDDEGFTDDVIIRLLAKDALQNLTMFSATSVDLSMMSVGALIEQCPLLDTLGNLDEWNDVTDVEIYILMQNIKDNNQDLKIKLWKDY